MPRGIYKRKTTKLPTGTSTINPTVTYANAATERATMFLRQTYMEAFAAGRELGIKESFADMRKLLASKSAK